MTGSRTFPYADAFSRNLGWFTEAEQLALRGKRVAIAGMGGAGGAHLLTLARLGIGEFTLADFDKFDFVNFNRQVGANIETVGRQKIEVMEEMARGVNPDLRVRRFDAGVEPHNITDFLNGVDVFVDGLDFFAIDIRRQVFARCAELNIPAVTAAPIGMGTCYLVFDPKGMSFERYFRLEGLPENEQYLRFLMGLNPKGLHRQYLVDPSRVNLDAKRGPSTGAACQLCAGVTAVAVAKLLLRRGNILAAPYHHHYDAYRGKFIVSKLRIGNHGPVQRLKLGVARKTFRKMAGSSSLVDEPAPRTVMEEMLGLARWSPSGDNSQRWKFKIESEKAVRIEIGIEPRSDIYEYRDWEPTWLSAGMLLETLRIAASHWHRKMAWSVPAGDGSEIAVTLCPDEAVTSDPLFASITERSVDRRAYRLRSLTAREKSALEDALGEDLIIDWHEKPSERWRFARVAALASDIRLRCPEAFDVHRRVIDWDRKLSPDAIPVGTIPLDPLTRNVMRWGMENWTRASSLNKLGGTVLAAIEMDVAPILASSAVFTIRRKAPRSDERNQREALLREGMQLQRFWLAATELGLALQPLVAVLGFAHYGSTNAEFTKDGALREKCRKVASSFQRLNTGSISDVVFVGRIGEPRIGRPACRSVRRPLSELVVE